nr:ComEC/Rec2 family competence protein [Nanchangia anserum]
MWLGTLAGLARAPAWLALAGVVTAGGIGAIRRAGSSRWLVVLALGAFAVGICIGSAQLHREHVDPLARALARETSSVTATLTGTVVQPWREVSGGSYMVTLDADTATVTDWGTHPTRVRVRLFTRTPAGTLTMGQRIRVAARLTEVRRGQATGRALSAPRVLATPTGARWRGDIHAAAIEAWGATRQPERGLGLGMTLGMTDRIDAGLNAAMARASLSHLTAVSGLHLAHVAGLALALTAPLPRRSRALAAALLIGGYIGLVAPTGSVIRATAMTVLSLGGLVLKRPHAGVPALAAATLVILGCCPRLATDIGFALSVVATASILLASRAVSSWLVDHGLGPALAQALAVPACAQLACTPLLVLLRPQLPLLAVVANVVAAPFVAPVMLAGLGVVAFAPWWPQAGRCLAWCAQWPLRPIAWVATHVSIDLPWASGAAGALLALGACVCGGYLWWQTDPVAQVRLTVRRWRLLRGQWRAGEK